MTRLTPLAALLAAACTAAAPATEEEARWERHAASTTITRDDWGIAHVRGTTDADAVFGMIYAQAEDDFSRVELNYLRSLGREAEADSDPQAIYRDLRMKLYIDPDDLRARFAASPAWLQALMTAWADGLNYFLETHPEVRPKVLTRFEPWMALSFTEGSIGGDIERISTARLKAFYDAEAEGGAAETAGAGDGDDEPRGSNGFAIGPSRTASGKAMLLINPHTSFFFRDELQMTSDEGLNAYGAVTWGQFFVYQGFNEHAGWMHTSSGVDNIDEFLETVTPSGDGFTYRYGGEERAVTVDTIVVPHRTGSGMAERRFTVYRTHRGPVVREQDGKWVTVRLMFDPVNALSQSYGRTKSRNYREFVEVMELHTNSSNNTVFADAEGNIAYFHSNFIPKRDPRFDWTRPVDGSNPATEWGPVHSVDETPNVVNPPNGWIQNTNNWPYSAAGANSPDRSKYPAYMETGGENPRGLHAIRVLEPARDMTLATLIEAAYDSYLTEFEILVPTLLRAYEQTPASDPLKTKLREPIDSLRQWDLRWSVSSVPTSVAVFWGEALFRMGRGGYRFIEREATPTQRLEALAAAVDQLEADFGTWKTPWGEINRFQRLTDDIVHPFDDAAPSIPVGFTSARWGSLASYGARAYPETKKWYGTSGNSFVAVVEFGDSVRARAVTAGGISGDTNSPHFNDQAARYATGDLREVYFYPNQLAGHTEASYRPGEKRRR
ncbi:MAG: penicillin acylase family protein [Gemmatimonadales bacterium]